MQTKFKLWRFTSLVLAIVMLFTIAPLQVFALSEDSASNAPTTADENVVVAAENTETEDSVSDVPATVSAESAKLKSLRVFTGFSESDATVLLKNAGDSYTTENVFSPDVFEYTLAAQTDSTTQLRFTPVAEVSGSTVMIYYFDGQSKDITWKSGSNVWANCLTGGKNRLEIVVTPPADSELEPSTYIINVDCKPTLTALNLGNGVYMDKTFVYSTFEYTATVSDQVEQITVNATPRNDSYKITYNGSASNVVDITNTDKIDITVTCGDGEDAVSNTYTVHLNKVPTKTVTFNVVPEDVKVVVYDHKGMQVLPNEDGSFSGLFADYDYTYEATKYGYVSKTGIVPGNESYKDIVLVKAPESTREDVSADWKNFRNSDNNMGITSANTPACPEETELLWSAKLGTGWGAAPSVQIIVDDALIVMSGTTLYKLDLQTGETIATAEMVASPNYGYTPMTYAEGLIFCPLANGTIQAFNAKTLESVWVYRDNLKGQSLSPIAYSDGYIYTGFWNSEVSNANYVCIDITDENPNETHETKLATWKFTSMGGFYWAGAVVIGDAVIFGTDDGTRGYDGDSTLYSLNKYTGEVISSIPLEGLGDQRSTIAYDEESGKIFFTTKNGAICSATVDPSTGNISDFKSNNIGVNVIQSTSTPVIYKGRIYYGVGAGFDGGNDCAILCLDAETLEMVYSKTVLGYPQCSVLISTVDEERTGYIYIYTTYNNKPGGISMIKVKPDAESADEAELMEIYDAAGYEQYCICSLTCGSDGTLYYKNDSGYVFAVRNTEEHAFDDEGICEYCGVHEGLWVCKATDGNWYGYENGNKKEGYTGLAQNENGWWYLLDDKVNFAYNDVVYDATEGWIAIRGGKYDETYTGFADNKNGTWYVENGKVEFDENGLILDTREGQVSYKYVVRSQFIDTYNGFAENENGVWRVEKGLVNFNATGVVGENLDWRYCVKGKVQVNHTGIKENANGWWRIVNGKVDFNATGVYQNENGWWKVENGKVNFSFNGIASNANGSWYIRGGKVDFSFNGKTTYNGVTYTVKGGKVV